MLKLLKRIKLTRHYYKNRGYSLSVAWDLAGGTL